MVFMLNDIDEAIDRKFLVIKTLPNQVEAGTIVHIMGAENNKDGTVTVYYRITYTRQDYTLKLDSLKSFGKWARPDNFIARHYENFTNREIKEYIKIKDRGFMNFCLPIIAMIALLIWVAAFVLLDGSARIIVGAVLTVAVAVAVFMTFRKAKQKALVRIYGKVSAASNWGVSFK